MADCSIKPLPAYVCTEAIPYCIGKLSLGLQSLVQNDSMYTAYAFETADVTREWVPARYKVSGGEITECETGDCPGSLNPSSSGVIYTTWYAPAVVAADARPNWIESLVCGTTLSAVGIGTPAVSPTVFTAAAVAGSAYSSTASNGDEEAPCTGGLFVRNSSAAVYPAGSVLAITGAADEGGVYPCTYASRNDTYKRAYVTGVLSKPLDPDAVGCLITAGTVRIYTETPISTTSTHLMVSASTPGVLDEGNNGPSRFPITSRSGSDYTVEVTQKQPETLCDGSTFVKTASGTLTKGNVVTVYLSSGVLYAKATTSTEANPLNDYNLGIAVTDITTDCGCAAVTGQLASTDKITGGSGHYLAPITTGADNGKFRRVAYPTRFLNYNSGLSTAVIPPIYRYTSYFTVTDMSNGTVTVCNGSNFDYDNPTGGGNMPVYVGTSVINVAPLIVTPANADYIYLHWNSSSPSTVEILHGGTVPVDSTTDSYYIIAQISVVGGLISNINQIHNTGIPRIWVAACPVSI